MKRLILTIGLLGWPMIATAQVAGGVMSVRDSSTGALVANVGDSANNAVRIRIVANDVGGGGGTSSSFGAAVPATGTAAGFSDGTNMQAARVFDADSGGGTQYVMGLNLRRSASGGSAELIGQATMANSVPVVLSSDQTVIPVSQSGTWTVQPGNTANTTAWLVRQDRSASATLANVASSATNVTCLASNAARRGAAFFNDSTQPVFLKYGATASASSYTVKVEGGGYYEMGAAGYSGIVDCLWSSANGNARVTEW
jgi:hypothetical protein